MNARALQRRALGIAHDAAIARGVVQRHRQQRHAIRARSIDQRLQGVRLCEWYIAREHDHQTIVRQHGHGLLHRMPSA